MGPGELQILDITLYRASSLAQKKICIADNTKVGKTTLCQIAPLSDIDAIVLERKPSDEWLEEFRRCEVACHYPNEAK